MSTRQPRKVLQLAEGRPLEFGYAGGVVTVALPAASRSTLVDVVAVVLSE